MTQMVVESASLKMTYNECVFMVFKIKRQAVFEVTLAWERASYFCLSFKLLSI